jgi:hypothetical protein
MTLKRITWQFYMTLKRIEALLIHFKMNVFVTCLMEIWYVPPPRGVVLHGHNFAAVRMFIHPQIVLDHRQEITQTRSVHFQVGSRERIGLFRDMRSWAQNTGFQVYIAHRLLHRSCERYLMQPPWTTARCSRVQHLRMPRSVGVGRMVGGRCWTRTTFLIHRVWTN